MDITVRDVVVVPSLGVRTVTAVERTPVEGDPVQLPELQIDL